MPTRPAVVLGHHPVRNATAIVPDLEHDCVGVVADLYGRLGGVGVAHHVGERLLHDAVGG
jgi:hypothetical protein